MSPADSANPAWLTVPPADGLPQQVAAEIGPVATKIGFMPNVARLLAISRSHVTGWWRYFDELMRGPSWLSMTQREMIAVVISAEARCPTARLPMPLRCGCAPRTPCWPTASPSTTAT